MKNTMRKGFTLVELLAVIIMLAIIALIALPVILNIINKVNKSAFKDTAYGIIQAGEFYFAERQLEPNGMLEDVKITLPDTTNALGLKGEMPQGTITVTKDGKISLMVKNNRYCITKGINDADVNITEDIENCVISNDGENSGENTENDLAIDITLNTTSVSIINSGVYQIEASVIPESALNKDLIYTSSNKDIATVDSNGLIKGVSGGTTTIIVSTTDGSNISKTVEVTVRQLLTELSLSPNSLEIMVGNTATVTANIKPTNAYNKVLKWISNDESIATVDSNGLIKGVSGGTTTITVSTTDGSNIIRTINVTVYAPVINIDMLNNGQNIGSGGSVYNATLSNGGKFLNGKFIVDSKGALTVSTDFMSGTDNWTIAFTIDKFVTDSTNTYNRIARGSNDVPSIFDVKGVNKIMMKISNRTIFKSTVSWYDSSVLYETEGDGTALVFDASATEKTTYAFRNNGTYISLWINGKEIVRQPVSKYTTSYRASTFSIGDNQSKGYDVAYMECSMLKGWDWALSDDEMVNIL